MIIKSFLFYWRVWTWRNLFDLCNLEERPTAKDNLLNLGLISEKVYTQLHAGTLTSYKFEVTSLVGMLPASNLTGSHVFNLTISDGNETRREL